MTPGAATSTRRSADVAMLLEIQGGKCLLCDEPATASECNLDHLWPDAYALVAVHVTCNSKKGHSGPTPEQRKRYDEIESLVHKEFKYWRRLFTLLKRKKR